MKRRAFVVLCLAPILGVACLLFAGHRLTWRVSPQEPEPDRLPSLLLEPLSLTTSDGLRLGAWWVPRGKTDCTVILLHGYGGRRSYELQHIELLHEIGCHVLAPSLRSHGDSEGQRTSFGWEEQKDVLAAIDTVEQLAPRTRLFVFGRSLGAASAMFAAEEAGDRVTAYVLESPFEDLEVATKNRMGFILPQAMIATAYAPLGWTSPLFLGVTPAEISPRKAAGSIKAPVLLLSGDLDIHATPAEASSIEQALARVKHVRFPEAAHDGLLTSDPLKYRTELQSWLQPQTIEETFDVGPALGPAESKPDNAP